MFKYETPPWGAKLICIAYLAVSYLMLLTFSTYEEWAGSSPAVIKYTFAILSFVFILPVLKPSNWRGWVYFSADNKGISFPTSFSEAKNNSSLNVAWQNVGAIKSEILYGNVRGISIELSISQAEIDQYFGKNALTNKLLGFNQKRNGFFVIAYANNAFQTISSVVDSLNEIKRSNI
ncbi:hypothetical protein AADZ84_15980 [Colwelliaceae bacterium MEBiC 14330]